MDPSTLIDEFVGRMGQFDEFLKFLVDIDPEIELPPLEDDDVKFLEEIIDLTNDGKEFVFYGSQCVFIFKLSVFLLR